MRLANSTSRAIAREIAADPMEPLERRRAVLTVLLNACHGGDVDVRCRLNRVQPSARMRRHRPRCRRVHG